MDRFFRKGDILVLALTAVAFFLLFFAVRSGGSGTAAVTVTMLTVLFFLGPVIGYRRLLSGSDLIMHLINPVLALVSFCVFERRGLTFGWAMLGLLPVVLYAMLYGWKVLLCPPERRWEDFYGFNKGGKWYLSFVLMLLGTFLVCLGLMGIQNL